jgi:hypothetical protein
LRQEADAVPNRTKINNVKLVLVNVLRVNDAILSNEKGSPTSNAAIQNKQSFKQAAAYDPERAAHN